MAESRDNIPPEVRSSLEAHEARLEIECKAFQSYRALLAVRQSLDNLAKAYSIPDGSADPRTSTEVGPSDTPSVPRNTGSRSNSFTAVVRREMRQVFAQRQRRAQSPEIVEILRERGIPVMAKNPIGSVSSALTSDNFFSNAHDAWGSGYGLREWDSKPTKAPTGQEWQSRPLFDDDPELVDRPDSPDAAESKTADQQSRSAVLEP